MDGGETAGAVVIDLSKAFDCITHVLLFAKLEAYDFGKDALTLIHSYGHGRRQRVKVNGSFRSWRTAIQSVSQGSVLGPLFFNIYINDQVVSKGDTDVCNYADDTTYYAHDTNALDVI